MVGQVGMHVQGHRDRGVGSDSADAAQQLPLAILMGLNQCSSRKLFGCANQGNGNPSPVAEKPQRQGYWPTPSIDGPPQASVTMAP